MKVIENTKKWVPYLVIICGLVGAILGTFLAYFIRGEYPYEVLAGALFASIILILIQIIKSKTRKDKVPEADERVVRNITRYFSYVSHTFLGVLFIALPVFTLIGYEAVPILYLWIFFFSYIWIAGVGSLIVKRR
ncbi:hypothetical protein ACFOLA_00800 [Salinicoccus hispanicus]|uniref:DUF2178 domain-containing protein n=1 Tax=Salinicoccus hispanicus TaxID=157225 RepID=A0A6N8U1V8_9STAP|nr:hypothetical protein [Salinicoccus hispanicus]MXQ50121.1 hypothetical protein [Salinicoccus hispanicus]